MPMQLLQLPYCGLPVLQHDPAMLLEDRPIAPDIEALGALIASGRFDDFAAGMFR